jgi:hypothetical protein
MPSHGIVIVKEINEKFSPSLSIEGILSQFADTLDAFRHCFSSKTNL